MIRSRLARGALVGSVATLLMPAVAHSQEEPLNAQQALPAVIEELNLTWLLVATVLVMFMQAGFLFLEIGFSRGKNVGSGVAKIFANFSIATIAWWACGFAVAFGGGNAIAGNTGFFLNFGSVVDGDAVGGSLAGFFLFQFMFCAVSLAIVWGTTLERLKFSAYVLFAVVFAALIYPLVVHWVWAGGFLAEIGGGVQDFAGSTVVHLTGATAGLAALLLLGARRGKYGADGRPRAIPGHSMPIFGLGVMILWLGWFGFNAGSTLGTEGSTFAEVAVVTQLGASGGVLGAMLLTWLKTRSMDVGMIGNGAIGGLVGITAPSGFVEFWAAPIIGFAAGCIVVVAILAIDKKLDDPVGALSAHGIAGVWGTISCGIFASPRLAEANEVGVAGLVYTGSFEQLGVQFAGAGLAFLAVLAMSLAVFGAIKATIGLRVSAEEEDAGLDISQHGMYGYPEQFIPEPELVGFAGAEPAAARVSVPPNPTRREVPAQ
jgi:ammonium transporter, Amt family